VAVEQDGREAPTIIWDRYDGAAPFAAYWVLRSTARRLPDINSTTTTTEQFTNVATVEPRVETVAVIADPQITTYEDNSLVANLRYVYRISVVNANGLEVTPATTVPVRGPSMQQLSFYSDRAGNWDVFVMNEDGSGIQNLTNHPAIEGRHPEYVWPGRPAWTPDRSKIAFTSDRDGNGEVYLMDADGSNQVNLTNHPANDMAPTWSPDGSRFVFTSDRDGDWKVYAMNVDGTGFVSLGEAGLGLDWSPDGSRIAFWWFHDERSFSEVYVMNADGTGVFQLADTPDDLDFDPVWSPDGSQIAWLGRSGVGVFTMNADGSNPVQINTGGAWPHWSPDGSQISYTCGDQGWRTSASPTPMAPER